MNDHGRLERSPTAAVAAILAMAAIGIVAAAGLARKRSREDRRTPDRGEGGGFLDRAGPGQGAIGDLAMPEDMRAVIPEPPSYAPA